MDGPAEHQKSGDAGRNGHDPPTRRDDFYHGDDDDADNRGRVEARVGTDVVIGERVAREKRHDPAGDDDEHHHDEIDGHEIGAQIRLRQQTGAPQMEVEVTDPQQRQDCEEKIVAPAPGEEQGDGQRDGKGRKKDEVGEAADSGGGAAEADQPSDRPQTDKGCEEWTARGRPIGPVFDRGQQKTGDDRHRVAEDHLVAVPRNALETGLPRCRLFVRMCPPGDQEHGPRPTQEEEWPEAFLENNMFQHRQMVSQPGNQVAR